MHIKQKHIYDYLFPVLWQSISEALLLCIKYKSSNKNDLLSENNPDLIACFKNLRSVKPSPDNHIVEGLYRSHQQRKNIYPRVLKLVLTSFEEAQEIKSKNSWILPSPLHIIYHLFIVPEHSYTAAYSITTCRSFLFNLLDIYPSHSKSNQTRCFNETHITDSLNDFNGFEIINNRWPKEIINSKNISQSTLKTPEIHSFVGHFLATRGIAHLWFSNYKAATDFLSTPNSSSKFLSNLREKMSSVRFRKSARYRSFPDHGEIINQIFGFPIPIPGADVVFYGGLKPSSNGGLIISISGRAGVGKTSLALTFADAFSPFGTNCFYLSLEEEIEDIKKRLHSLRPHVEKELGFFPKQDDWFCGFKYPDTVALEIFTEEIREMAKEISNEINSSATNNPLFHSVCPYIVVIDNITELVADFNSDHYGLIEAFIEQCRNLNAIVILLSPNEVMEKLKIEYLVDIGIELRHKDIDKDDAKPIRIFNLFKTRHQLSRQGAHIFHMSGREGFRISPQIPSQIDRKENIRRNLHDESKLIHMLNFINKDKKIIKTLSLLENKIVSRKLFIRLYPRTHILIHGYGSVGKAGFALKLLLTPAVRAEVDIDKIPKGNYSHLKYRRKILIISFLYPEKYYEELVTGKKFIQADIESIYPKLTDPIVEYLVLYPGYLMPQDFLNKVTRKLDEAALKGQPYTGVLIDGLHNVFLQFEKLQDSNMVWPMLYNILSRYDLTVVSTFTNFSLNDKLVENDQTNKNLIMNQAVSDHLLLQKGMAPFLHALVKASDYYFFMEQHPLHKKGSKKYLLSIKSSIGQYVPEEFLEWERENNQLINIYTREMLNK